MQALDPLDQEQLGILKHYWQTWGNVILVTALAFILSYAGFKYWESRKISRAEEAAAIYEVLESHIIAKNSAAALQELQTLMRDFADAHDTAMAALQVARLQYDLDKTNVGDSIKTLEWVIAHASEAWVRDWARIQTMQLDFAEKQYDKVINLADRRETQAATAVMMELKGDALVQKNDLNAAKLAYEQAHQADANVQPFEGNTPRHQNNPILRMKRQSVGSTL